VLKPSQADINLTQKIKEAAGLLDIELLDHLIVSLEDYYSLTQEGKMEFIR
jgi:DNA repair protein RadC